MLQTYSVYRWLLNMRADTVMCSILSPLRGLSSSDCNCWIISFWSHGAAKQRVRWSRAFNHSPICLKFEHPLWYTLPRYLRISKMLMAESIKMLSCKYLLFLCRKPYHYATRSWSNARTAVEYFLCCSQTVCFQQTKVNFQDILNSRSWLIS